MKKESIIKDLSSSSKSFIETVSIFPDEYFTLKPSESVWSAAEILEHVVIVESLLNFVLKGKTSITEDRNPEDKIVVIKKSFQNFKKKYSAYGPIIPSAELDNKAELIKKFNKNRESLIISIKTLDLDLICLDFEHGLFGSLSRIEWIYFIIYHSQRHEHQIKNINLNRLK